MNSAENNIEEYENKFIELCSEIKQLCRINYKAVDLYKEILDITKQRNEAENNELVVYTIIERVRSYISSEDWDISKFEKNVTVNLQFIEQCNNTKEQLEDLKKNIWKIDQENSVFDFQSPTNFSNSHSKSHLRNTSSDVNTENSKNFETCKENLLSKNPSMVNCTENLAGKSRNMNQGTLSSKTLIQSDRYNSTSNIRDQRSIHKFNQKVFQTAENYQK